MVRDFDRLAAKNEVSCLKSYHKSVQSLQGI